MESFVARHVLVQLIHGGDIDGTDDPNHSGADGEEAGGICCINRRQTSTLVIFMLTLLPTLFLDDLGPILSLNGCIGGCFIGKLRSIILIYNCFFLFY